MEGLENSALGFVVVNRDDAASPTPAQREIIAREMNPLRTLEISESHMTMLRETFLGVMKLQQLCDSVSSEVLTIRADLVEKQKTLLSMEVKLNELTKTSAASIQRVMEYCRLKPKPENSNPLSPKIAAPHTTAAETTAAETTAVETKAVETTAVETKAVETKAVETKAVETTAVETKAVETKAVETTAVETKAVETKAVETKAVETKAVETKAVETADARAPPAAPPQAQPEAAVHATLHEKLSEPKKVEPPELARFTIETTIPQDAELFGPAPMAVYRGLCDYGPYAESCVVEIKRRPATVTAKWEGVVDGGRPVLFIDKAPSAGTEYLCMDLSSGPKRVELEVGDVVWLSFCSSLAPLCAAPGARVDGHLLLLRGDE